MMKKIYHGVIITRRTQKISAAGGGFRDCFPAPGARAWKDKLP